MLVVPAVLAVVSLRALVQRSTSDVKVALLDYLFHMAEEQGHDQSGYMRAIHIGIGHDNYFVVADLTQVQRFRVLFGSECDTKSREDITDFFALEYLMLHRFLYVQNLTSQRQNSLVNTVTTGLRSSACGISLDQEQLALSRILAHAIRQFTRQTTAAQRRLPQHTLTRVTGCDTCLSRQNHFLYDLLCIIRMFLQVVLQCLGYGTRNHAGYFRVTELRLRLTLKLRLCHFHGDNCRQTLTEIVRIDRRVAVFVFQLRLLQHLAVLRVFLHHTRQRSAETGYVRTAFNGVDIVHI